MTRKVSRKVKARTRLAVWVSDVGLREGARQLDVDHAHLKRVCDGEKGVSGALALRIQERTGIPFADWFATA